jgi:hypothetical protein
MQHSVKNEAISEIDQSKTLNESSDVSLKGHLLKDHNKHLKSFQLKSSPSYRKIFTHLESKGSIDPHEEAK